MELQTSFCLCDSAGRKLNYVRFWWQVRDQSYLMVHLLTPATCWFDFRQKQRFFVFSLYLQIGDALFIRTVKYVLVQLYKCTHDKTMQNYVRNLFIQWTTYFPNVQVLFSNVATTIKFVDNRCLICLQLFKCTSAVLRSDRSPQPNALTIDTWLIFRIKLLGKLRFFPTKCTNVGFRSQS